MDSTTNTWIDLTNLTNNERYYFRVTARDSSDVESPFSNEENVLAKFVRPGDNLVVNGDFSSGVYSWQLNLSTGGVAAGTIKNAGEYAIFIRNGGAQISSVQLVQPGIALVNGSKYQFEFDAYATENRTIDARLEQNGGSYTNYSRTSTVALTTAKTHKSYSFTMNSATDANARVIFNVGLKADTVYLDNVSVKEVMPTVVGDAAPIPATFKLLQNYPNPFNPTTVIGFELPAPSGVEGPGASDVRLAVYDLLGREVATLVNEPKQPGVYTVSWDAAGLASGIYYCELVARAGPGQSGYRAARKILLMK